MQHERSRPCTQNALGSDLCPPSIKVLVSSIFPLSTMFYTDGVYAVLWDVTSHKSVSANISEDLQSSFSGKKKMEAGGSS